MFSSLSPRIFRRSYRVLWMELYSPGPASSVYIAHAILTVFNTNARSSSPRVILLRIIISMSGLDFMCINLISALGRKPNLGGDTQICKSRFCVRFPIARVRICVLSRLFALLCHSSRTDKRRECPHCGCVRSKFNLRLYKEKSTMLVNKDAILHNAPKSLLIIR